MIFELYYLCQMARIVVGMSGGVDSSVAAYLLKAQGHEVIGMFMKNWHDESVTISNDCPWLEDSTDALLVANKLNIPFHTIDFSKEYFERIVDYMFVEYQAGRTPNPDVLCNREIKFDLFLKKALELNADFVATGHYCQREEITVNGKIQFQLLAGADPNKDQSYFLCQISEAQLSKALFPIGHLLKPEVRKIAEEQDLITANKKDSQGLCFIGKVKLPEFLQQKLSAKKGKAFEIPADLSQFTKTRESLEEICAPFEYSASEGIERGVHDGAHFFTIGQRKGIGIGGSPLPLFCIKTDVEKNIVFLGQGEDHPGLFRKGLKINNGDIHWINAANSMKDGETRIYEARIRYRQDLSKATLHKNEKGLHIIFDLAQKAIAAGQFAAWYDGKILIGSGIISA
jgi:tRNA-specific 2-thiouridylase